LSFLARQFYFESAHAQAIATAQRALTLASAGGDAVLHALVNTYLGNFYQAQGDYRRAIDCFAQTMAFFDEARRRERFGELIFPAVFTPAWRAWCHAELGMFAEGRPLAEEGLRIAEAVAHPSSLALAFWGVGLLCLRQGDLPKALSLLEQSMVICQELAFSAMFPVVATALGAAYTLVGRIADAVPLLTEALEQAMTIGRRVYQAHCRLTLGETQRLAGRLEEAHALAEQALELACAHQERGNQAYARRLLGEIAAHHEPPETEQAEDHYRQALALAEALGMRPLQAHCHLGLGTLYAKTERGEQAHAELSAAIALYRAMDMIFWLPQAEAALAQVEVP
jgi:tetratricopeptide (TPR) repeat protein